MATIDWGKELPRLDAERVALRGIRQEDAEEILRIFGDPEVTRYWSAPPLEGIGAARALVSSIEDLFERRELFQWGIVRRDDDRIIGTTTLYHLDHAHRRAEIGFALGRDSWGHGLAAEAVARVIDFSFTTLDLHRLEADTDPENEAALRLLERLGFQREGYLRERWQVGGEVRDGVFLGLLRPEWEKRGSGNGDRGTGIGERGSGG